MVGLFQFGKIVVNDHPVCRIHAAKPTGSGKVFVRIVQFARTIIEISIVRPIDRKGGGILLVLADQTQIIQYPKRPAGSRGDQIALMHTKVGDRRNGQIQLKRRPVVAAIPRNKEAKFRAGKQQIFSHFIFPDDAGKRI